MEDEDLLYQEELNNYINSERINPVDVAPAIDMKTNPRLSNPKPGEKLLPVQEKSEYWRDELRRGKDPRDVLNQYLMDRFTQGERSISPSSLKDNKKERSENLKTNMYLDLMKSGADLGASFGNKRWKMDNGEIPVSGFNPSVQKGYLQDMQGRMLAEKKGIEDTRNMDQRVLQYLAEQKQKAEQAEKDRQLKLQIAKMRAENDPFKALMFGFKQAEENRQRGEYKMAEEKHQVAMEKAQKESAKEDELTSRYKNQMRNLDKLQKIIDETNFYETNPITEGISNVFSSKPTAHSSEIDKTIYDLALDYAKIVDPTSVAREGEVAAAEKYALPIKRYLMLGQKDAAKKLIEDHRRDIQSRVMSATKGGGLPSVTKQTVKIKAPDGSIREVPASSADKYIKKGGKLVE